MATAYYPTSPAQVPANFHKPSFGYGLMVGATLLSILLFVALYLVLLMGAGCLLWWVATHYFDHYGLWLLFLHLGAVAAAGMLVVFLLKFLFKGRQTSRENWLRLVPEAHPRLLGFLEQLCAETGVALPRAIYLSPEVNAAVFYERPLLSLVWPVRKSLLIGAGLVNALTLSEFKAVLAHEFGHFAQRSMRLHSYVYSANLVLHDIVFRRDKWDEVVANWRGPDIWGSAAAWVLTALVWLVRQVLEVAYRGVNLVYARLAREMEFQADRVAVRVAGSSAIIDALYQINRASAAYHVALGHLATALEHGLATDDVYYHQALRLAEAPAAPAAFRSAAAHASSNAFLFAAEEVTLKADMYASHPTGLQREQHARSPFVPAASDARSPWLLFTQPGEVRRLVTAKLYRHSIADAEDRQAQPAREVEAFLSAETEELTYDPCYAETYDTRLITAVAVEALDALAAELPTGPALLALRAELYGPELHRQMAQVKERQKALQRLHLFASQQVRDATFEVAGVPFPARHAAGVIKQIEQEGQASARWLEEFDRRAAALHWRLLGCLPERQPGWRSRYALQMHLRLGLALTQASLRSLHQLLPEIIGRPLNESQCRAYLTQLAQLQQQMVVLLLTSKKSALLPLRHLEGFATVGDYLLQATSLPSSAVLSAAWITGFVSLLDTVQDRYRRLYFKNLGALLRLQEKAAAEYALTIAPPERADSEAATV
ncbi:M48 family metallopeptidase [Hymenobacter sp. BT491]|uniref:M48 family metallopeptidase n=1 Tax=Hymenobacter sp. BT491 TaxID=2766779 RepID=UPI001653D6A3|nr:M48 family metallopeptidase [Hymenobacter sp. BT491]MBC6992248.1 M48 family metallopeptidase [Hymenobacter sp. BT491]